MSEQYPNIVDATEGFEEINQTFQRMVERHSLGELCLYYFHVSEVNIGQGMSAPVAQAWLGMYMNPLDKGSQRWFGIVTGYGAKEEGVEKSVITAFEWLRARKAEYLTSFNGQGKLGG